MAFAAGREAAVKASGIAREASTRAMLRAYQGAGGALDPAVAELAAGRACNPQPFRRALPPYGETERARLTEVTDTHGQPAPQVRRHVSPYRNRFPS